MITSVIAMKAMDALRAASVRSGLPKNEIAKRTNVGRDAVTKRLQSDDIRIGAFFDTAEAIGVDPIQILSEAYEQHKKALADKEGIR